MITPHCAETAEHPPFIDCSTHSRVCICMVAWPALALRTDRSRQEGERSLRCVLDGGALLLIGARRKQRGCRRLL